MRFSSNGTFTRIGTLEFGNGWTVSVANDGCPSGSKSLQSVMIYDPAGAMVEFPGRDSSLECELHNVDDDKLVELLAYVRKVSPGTALKTVGEAFSNFCAAAA